MKNVTIIKSTTVDCYGIAISQSELP